MKRQLMIAVLGLILAGCSSARYKSNAHEWNTSRRATMNQWMVQDYHDESIRNGVIASHALFEHHFVANAAELNELGDRDLGILADHYADHPGELSVHRGRVGGDLHAARVQKVKETLADLGVDVKRIALGDGMPGGSGMSGPMVLRILDQKMDQPLSTDQSVSGSFTGGASTR